MSILIPKYKLFEQGLKIGEYDIVLPDPPDLRKIENYGIPQEQQMWRPPKKPNPNTMSRGQLEGWQDHIIDKCYELGHWLFINGKIVYMTPAHFMYCGFWPIDIGLPAFRWTNAKFFYLWRDVELDEKSVGLIEVTNRRDGKTFRGGFVLYHRASVASNAGAGLQSKTDTDAKKVFRKAIINPFKKLPKFMQPTWDGSNNPRAELNFYAPTKKLSALEMDQEEALETSIDFRSVVEEAYDGEYLVAYLRDEAGKCLAPGTMVMMFDGSCKAVESVKNGDLVMGPDSKPRMVSGTAHGIDEMYEIQPNKGAPWRCNKDHILSLKVASKDKFKSIGLRKGDVLNVTVSDYLKMPIHKQKHLVLWRTGVDFPYRKTPIDPYVLGIWLGDGNSRDSRITTTDSEILEALELYCDLADLKIEATVSDKITYAIRNKKDKQHWHENSFRKALKELSVMKNKHIPSCYLLNDQHNRLSLLAGLIDSDGHASSGTHGINCYEITQKNYRLAKNIESLCNSLGFHVVAKEKTATMRRKDGSMYNCLVYRISIYGEIHKIPCKVARKKASPPSQHINRKNPSHTGFKVVPVGTGEYYGFALKGKDRLFLLADGTVTHNTVKADVHAGHEFTKYCFYKGSDIVGKALYTTTVEEMEKKGGKNLFKLWKDSDPERAKDDPLGQTVSNLRRYFKPGYEGLEGRHPITKMPFIDRYGFDILGPDGQPIAKEYLEQRRQKFEISKDWNGLASEKRKYPFTVEEAFRQDAKDCHFNAEILQSRISFLESRQYQDHPETVRGDFLWKDGESDSEVVWVPSPHGRFLVWKMPSTDLRNNKYRDSWGRWVPGNVDMFGAGSDSYDHKKVNNENRASNLAFYIGRKFDTTVDIPSLPPMMATTRLPWLEYVNRPPRPEDAWEDCLKACVFYGCRLFPETNKPGMRNYFENRGYINYLQDRPDWTYTNPNANHENTKGMASVVGTIEQYADLLTTWVEDRAMACRFPRLLNHLLEFEIDNTTKFDCAVGWGYALICMGVRPRKKIPTPDLGAVTGLVHAQYTPEGIIGTTVGDGDSGILPMGSYDIGSGW